MKVILHPIGSPVEDAVDVKAYEDNCRRMDELNDLVVQRRAEVREGWGDEYVQRVHAKGQQFARAYTPVQQTPNPLQSPQLYFRVGAFTLFVARGIGKAIATFPHTERVTCYPGISLNYTD